jgi:hypothetical protein
VATQRKSEREKENKRERYDCGQRKSEWTRYTCDSPAIPVRLVETFFRDGPVDRAGITEITTTLDMWPSPRQATNTWPHRLHISLMTQPTCLRPVTGLRLSDIEDIEYECIRRVCRREREKETRDRKRGSRDIDRVWRCGRR